jgi:succinate dehydrogenase / fumarate reductase flavoprotein subunit
LRATLGMAEQGLKTACITKVFPTRSHTVAAQGGIAASLATWARTLAGTCTTPSRVGLAGRPGRHRISGARGAEAAVYELEHYGVPFSRTEEGKIYQRPFGGHMTRISAKARRCSAPAPPPTAPATPSCTRSTASR